MSGFSKEWREPSEKESGVRLRITITCVGRVERRGLRRHGVEFKGVMVVIEGSISGRWRRCVRKEVFSGEKGSVSLGMRLNMSDLTTHVRWYGLTRREGAERILAQASLYEV